MKRVAIVVIVLLSTACHKNEAPASQAAAPAPVATASSVAPQATAKTAAEPDLASLASGAFFVVHPESSGDLYYMIDDDDTTGFVTDTMNQPAVLELAGRSVIHSLAFRTQKDEVDSRYPKDLLIEMSDTSAQSGFSTIADLHFPPEPLDGKTFPVSASVPGRWLRITPKSAQSGSVFQIMDFYARGEQLSAEAPPNVTGSWNLDGGALEIKQDGPSVTGCLGERPFSGGIEGRALKFTADFGENGKGPAILVIAGDGHHLTGGWWRGDSKVEERPKLSLLSAVRKSDTPSAACAAWKKEDPITSELREHKRVRLYGINFDSDSDQLRAESKPVLDRVAAILKSNAAWKLTVEGHTDSTAAAEHNQDLSDRRARTVVTYLTAAGIDGARLTAKGFGASTPVATNETELGRAANRRVELTRE